MVLQKDFTIKKNLIIIVVMTWMMSHDIIIFKFKLYFKIVTSRDINVATWRHDMWHSNFKNNFKNVLEIHYGHIHCWFGMILCYWVFRKKGYGYESLQKFWKQKL
jgi:hypothetical protein